MIAETVPFLAMDNEPRTEMETTTAMGDDRVDGDENDDRDKEDGVQRSEMRLTEQRWEAVTLCSRLVSNVVDKAAAKINNKSKKEIATMNLVELFLLFSIDVPHWRYYTCNKLLHGLKPAADAW